MLKSIAFAGFSDMNIICSPVWGDNARDLATR